MARQRICSFLMLTILLATLYCIRVGAEVAAVSLADMNSRATFVGVVHEENVAQISRLFEFLADQFPRFPLFWRKTAYASVREVWKGSRYMRISCRASPSWVCDESKASAGTDAVVFLDRAYYGFEIAWAGYGRYPVVKNGSVSYIDVRDGNFPPELTPKISGISKYKRHLALEDLRVWCQAHNR